MKKNAPILATVGVLSAIVAMVALHRQSVSIRAGAKPATQPDPVRPTQSSATAPELPTTKAEITEADLEARPGNTVRVAPGRTLATINGHSIMLKDLVPDGDRGNEREMAAGLYQFLLDRAIERQLVFETARQKHLELTPEQSRRLEALFTEDSCKAANSSVFDWLGRSEANAQFEARDLAGTMLAANLAAAAGAPSPYVTREDVVGHVQANPADFPGLSAEAIPAQVEIQIRQRLAPKHRAAYQQWFAQYMARLKAGATITVVRN
jgi:hypothetical protein